MSLPQVDTDRLELRPFASGDDALYHAIWGDPEVIWWGASPDRATSAQRFKALLVRCAAMPHGLGWSWLVEKEDGTVVGDVCLQPAPNPPGGIEIGWHLARAQWGNGYATEGAAPLLEHAWTLGLEEVTAMIVPVNTPSIRVAERLGMERRGPIVDRGGLAHGLWVAAAP